MINIGLFIFIAILFGTNLIGGFLIALEFCYVVETSLNPFKTLKSIYVISWNWLYDLELNNIGISILIVLLSLLFLPDLIITFIVNIISTICYCIGKIFYIIFKRKEKEN